MPAILALVQRILNYVLVLVDVVNAIRGYQVSPAEQTHLTLMGTVSDALVNFEGPPSNVHAHLDAMEANLQASLTQLSADVATLTAAQAGVPGDVGTILVHVETPEDITAGLSGDTMEAIAYYVWAQIFTHWTYKSVSYTSQASDVMINLMDYINTKVGGLGYPSPRSPFFALVCRDPAQYTARIGIIGSAAPFTHPLNPDWSGVLAGESLLDFLNRTQPSFEWTYTSPWGGTQAQWVWSKNMWVAYPLWFRCVVPEWQLPFVDGEIAGGMAGVRGRLPPVWPMPSEGLVTLGDPVAIENMMTIAVPMHGVLVHLAFVPPSMGGDESGDHTLYWHMGWVSFLADDEVSLEAAQWLQFNEHLYAPKSMSKAAGAVLRFHAGVTGTVTPWSYVE